MGKKKNMKMIVFYVCVWLVLVLWIECKDRNEEVIQKKPKATIFFAFMFFFKCWFRATYLLSIIA